MPKPKTSTKKEKVDPKQIEKEVKAISKGEKEAAAKEAPTKSKTSGRRKSFCARMGGMKKRLTSAKTARDPNSRINKALRKWAC